jgi:hypothetical protein
MSEQKQLFSASLAKDARYKTGLRSFNTVVIDKMSPAAAAH